MTHIPHHYDAKALHRNELPEGVLAYGWRYRVRITTPTRSYVLPEEYDSPEEAHQAYREALSATWNG